MILGNLFLKNREPLCTPEQVELPSQWYEFEKTLGTYKLEYKKRYIYMKTLEKDVEELAKDIEILTDSARLLVDSNAKKEVSDVVERIKNAHGFNEKQKELSRVMGECKSMENVLEYTNAKQYNEFTCSVCMDNKVDHFLDPCGHMMCIMCFLKSRSDTCPMCRTHVQPKKIYLTM